ncbi:MAG: ribosome biogenesis GTPase YlqF [Clostridia bacterium]|nr:ribosome biogenesis GTPase YlqF [Clostridia bacterium]
MAKDMYQKRAERKDKKLDEKDKSLPSTNINWYPGHMLKTKRQIIEDLKLIDIVIEILDARIPISSRNPDMKQIIQNKKTIIILNKSDLAVESETKKWIEYYKQKGMITLVVDANLGKGIKELLKQIEEVMLQDMKKAAEKGRIRKNIRVMILGIPNVGKSSLINRLCNKKSTIVGNRPGVTKQKQWVRIANNIELLDTPGVLWPKFQDENVALNLSYTGSIKDEILDITEVAFKLLKYLYKNYQISLINRYNFTQEEIQSLATQYEDDEIYNLMKLIGKKRGAVVTGGEIDEEKTANIILSDFRSGKLGRITLERVR